MKNWHSMTARAKLSIYEEISNRIGLPPFAIEKDWWIVRTLALIFQMDIAPYLVFKGGTSLSKAWNIIERFSEDIDLALDRKYLGFEGKLSKNKVKKLRKVSFEYLSKTFFPNLKNKFHQAGIAGVAVEISPSRYSDQDPLVIEIRYPNLTGRSEYIHPRILVEIGSRSLHEPFTLRAVPSLIRKHLPITSFSEASPIIPTVNPERTFLEKIFLLHEEFQKPREKIRVHRLSRHLYDIEKLMDTEFSAKALSNPVLYMEIVKHREIATPVRGVDYSLHQPGTIDPIPPADIIKEWKKDYQIMRESMIYGSTLSFEYLIQRITLLKTRINELKWVSAVPSPHPAHPLP